MRWQITQHGWPVGQFLIDVGTFIDGPGFRNPITGEPLPTPLPITARALDQAAYDQLCEWYPEEFWRWLQYDPHTVQPKQPRRW
jgi:hypothetical protein